MQDIYVKAVLTVIALATTVLAIQGFMPSAQNYQCGATSTTACYVQPERSKFDVFVTNWE
jgi:hypothetical protein